MRHPLRAVLAAAVLAVGSITTVVLAGPAEADTRICEQYGSTTIGGRYTVMNNRWGTTAEQCINVTSTGRASRDQNQAIREWANKNGFEVSERGRIPSHIVEAYHSKR